MVQAYFASGNEKKAKEILTKIAEDITTSVKETEEDENAAHHADAELANVYLLLKNYDLALTHGENEYNRRPDNIDVNALMAWIYYNKGEPGKSLPFIKNALRTNSKNPTLLCQAGLMYYKTGDETKAKALLSEALRNDPNIDSALKEECKNILQTI
jgi:Tfp pilus assembly protein PilF